MVTVNFVAHSGANAGRAMSGARFVRVDLHVHFSPDGRDDPIESAVAYLQGAVDRNIEVLAVTDHNHARNVRAALQASTGTRVLVIPGIEVNSRDGHLIALFDATKLDELEAFASVDSLDLGPVLPDGSRRSAHTMLHLLNEIDRRGGIGLIAHADANGGIQDSVSVGDLQELLTHPALAGIEFRELQNLRDWFTDDDSDASRREAWRARQRNAELEARGLARVMSSDAHESTLVGKDGADRPLTRLRLGQPTFTAVRNALVNNPKARCRVEALLPASYPRLISATFEGGFLGGVSVEFSGNLNCLIGGRGSGKSTALIAIRAALGADMADASDDPDDPVRMPARTTITFLDAAGTQRVAIRDRGDSPRDEDGALIELPLADLGQGESGDVASNYLSQPLQMLAYLDSFCDLDNELYSEREVLDRLTDNAAEVIRTSFRQADLKATDEERQKLEASIKAAERGALEDIAVWALRLASQNALVTQVRAQLQRVSAARTTGNLRTLAELATETKADLSQAPIMKFAGELDKAQAALGTSAKAADAAHATAVRAASVHIIKVLADWDAEYLRWETKRKVRQAELEAQGLRVQVGALTEMGKRFEALTKRLADLQEKQRQHIAAVAERDTLLAELRERRRLIYERRKRTLKLVTKRANESTLGLEVSVSFTHEGIRRPWRDWLGPQYRFKGDRLMRLGLAIKPWEFASAVRNGDVRPIATLTDKTGDRQPFFSTSDVEEIASLSWEDLFKLDCLRLEDLPRITR